MSSCISIIKEPEGILKGGAASWKTYCHPQSWRFFLARPQVNRVRSSNTLPATRTTLKRSDISILVTSHTHPTPPPPTATEGSKTAEGQQMRADQQAKPFRPLLHPRKQIGCPRLEESCQIRELMLKPARSVTFTEIMTKSKHKRNTQSHRRKKYQYISSQLKNLFSCYQGHRKTI